VSGQYEIVEQGSAEDIGQQVDVTLRTPRGAIPAVPDFGLPDQTFQPDQGAIDATIEKWVPDAAPTIETTIINPADTGSARIDVDVEDSGT
jgi:phage baseplate assembly protein W